VPPKSSYLLTYLQATCSCSGGACGLGWPSLHWFVTENLSKSPKDWLPPARPADGAPAYVEVSLTSSHVPCMAYNHVVLLKSIFHYKVTFEIVETQLWVT